MITRLHSLSPLQRTNSRTLSPLPVREDRLDSNANQTELGAAPWVALGLTTLGLIPGLAAAQAPQAQVQVVSQSVYTYPSQVEETLQPIQTEVLQRLQTARQERRQALQLPASPQRDHQLSQAQQELQASLDMWQGLFQVHNGLEQMSSDNAYVRWEGSPNVYAAEGALQKVAQHYHYFDQTGQKQMERLEKMVQKLAWEDTFAPPGVGQDETPGVQPTTTQEMLQTLSDMNVEDGRAGNGGAEALREATQLLAQQRQEAWNLPHATQAQRDQRTEKILDLSREAEAHRHRRNGAFQMHLQLQRLNTH